MNAIPDLLDAAAFLDEVRAQVARGALCPMCSTGMTRQTVGMVCQLCGTDYGSPEGSDLRRDSEQASKAVLSDALTVRAERDALLAIIDDARHALSADGPKVEPARQVLARALPQITAWQDRTRHARDNTPPHVIAHRGAQLDAVTAERDALAAKVERVRAWLMSRGVDVSDRDGDYMDGYRAAQRHAVRDAAALLAALDGEADR